MKYKSVAGDGNGAVYILLRWDNTTLIVYLRDTADGIPIYVGEIDLISEGAKDLSQLCSSQGAVGLGEDICGNFSKIKKYFKDGIKLQKLVTEKECFSNALKGKKTGKAVFLSDVSPIEHKMSVECEGTVTRYGSNIFDGHLRACIHSDNVFSNYDKAPVKSDVYQSLKIWLPEGTYSINSNTPINLVRLVVDGNYSQYSRINTFHDSFAVTKAGYVGITFRRSDETTWDFNDKIWMNAGAQPTEYTPYIQPVAYASGEGVESVYPTTTLISESEMTVSYNRDINKAFAMLGGE